MATVTENKSEDIELIEPYNPLDPIVVFDPEVKQSPIVMRYNPPNEETGDNSNFQDSTKEDAIRFPLIKLNNKIIEKTNIEEFTLTLRDFLPHLKIQIADYNKTIQNTDVPGMNNVVTVIMVAPEDGSNKKISLDFYITKCDFFDKTIVYEGDLTLKDLRQVKWEQIGDDKLTTYDMLQTIAKDCGLGFAATENCSTINDARWRQIYSKTYVDYINEQMELGGLDEYSIFDAWVDQFNYLTLVNIPWVMSEPVAPNQLVTKLIGGETLTETDFKVPEQTVAEVPRTISNTKDGSAANNMMFNKFESAVSNEKIMEDGTLTTFFYLSDPGGANGIITEQVQIIENSIDGIEGNTDYEFGNCEFLGVEMGEDVPILKQKRIVTAYLRKIRAKQLYVEMPKPNHNLQRGMLINVMSQEYQTDMKRTILMNMDNSMANPESEKDTSMSGSASEKAEGLLNGDNANSDAQTDAEELVEKMTPDEGEFEQSDFDKLIEDESFGVPNPAISGMYYIDMVEYKYKKGDADIKQCMYLIKRGMQSSLTNKYAPANLTTK